MQSITSQLIKKVYLFLLFTILSSVCFAQEKSDTNIETIKILQKGETAPINKLKDTDGNFITFPTPKKWNIVFYFSLFCHSCIEEMPEIQLLLKELDADKVDIFFVALNPEKMKKALKAFKKSRNITQSILMEIIEKQRYVSADSWGVSVTPSVFLVNELGDITFSNQGPLDIEVFTKNIPDALFKNPKNLSLSAEE